MPSFYPPKIMYKTAFILQVCICSSLAFFCFFFVFSGVRFSHFTLLFLQDIPSARLLDMAWWLMLMMLKGTCQERNNAGNFYELLSWLKNKVKIFILCVCV